jgi:formate-dependent nitrite reductase cytochrome c552 subunit
MPRPKRRPAVTSMPTGTWSIDAITIMCPDCSTPYTDKNGSQMLTRESIANDIKNGYVVCPNCINYYRLPAILKHLS